MRSIKEQFKRKINKLKKLFFLGKRRYRHSANLNESLFQRIHFLNPNYLPEDILLSLNSIRDWANNEGIIKDESQLVTQEQEMTLRKEFSPKDKLGISVQLYKKNGDLNYTEVPFVPVKVLIGEDKEVQLTYWRMHPTKVDPETGEVKEYKEVYFELNYPNIPFELASLSNAKKVCRSFLEKYQQFKNNYPSREFIRSEDRKLDSPTSLEIKVKGEIKADFSKEGRFYKVEFSK